MAGEEAVADLESGGDTSKTIGKLERVSGGVDVESDEQLFHPCCHASVTVAPVSTVPTRSEILEIRWRSM